MFLLSDICAFVVATIIPVWLVAYFLKKFGKFKEIDNKFIVLFAFLIFCLSILISIFWTKFVFNHVYYEWDQIFIFYFSLIVRDYPVMEGLRFFDTSNGMTMVGSWLAKGWSQFYLFLLWFVLVLVIYIITSLLTLIILKKLNDQKYRKFTIRLIGILTLLSFLMGISNLGNILIEIVAYPQLILFYGFSIFYPR